MKRKNILLALALVFTVLMSSADSYDFDCNSMDIKNAKTAPLATNTFPHRVVCSITDDNNIRFDVYAIRRYTGLIAQVFINGKVSGMFRSRAHGSNPNAVGEDYIIGCTDKQAMVSSSKNDKFQAEGRWFNSRKEPLTQSTVECVVTVVETEATRWVKHRIPATKEVSKAPAAIPHQPPPPPTSRPQLPPAPAVKPPVLPQTAVKQPLPPAVKPPQTPPPAARPPQTPPPAPRPPQTPAQAHQQPAVRPPQTPPPTPRPPPTTTPRPTPPPSRDLGRISLDGAIFPSHCRDESNRLRAPLPNTGCSEYITASSSVINAYQSCDSGCFDAVTCMCTPCDRMSCPSSKNSPRKLRIFDGSGEQTGEVEWESKKQPGLTAGFSESLNVQGDTNPLNIPNIRSNSPQRQAAPIRGRSRARVIDDILSLLGR